MAITVPLQLGKVSVGSALSVVGVVDDFYDIDYLISLSVAGLSILELRLDLFSSYPLDEVLGYFKKIFQSERFGVIGTIRQVPETRLVRPALFEKLLPFVHMIDVEYDSPIRFKLIALARQYRSLVLISDHDYQGTPLDEVIQQRYEDMVLMGADLVKFAYYAEDRQDMQRLLMLCSTWSSRGIFNRQPHVAVMSMGEVGRPSRLISAAFGSVLTYGYLGQVEAAPGQWAVQDLLSGMKVLYPQ